MPKALVIVDVQNDFLPGGSLAVDSGFDIIPPINELMQSPEFSLIVATKDHHPQSHVSFASNHPNHQVFDKINLQRDGQTFEITLWPDHCVQCTKGADFPPQLNATNIQEIILKGQVPDTESFSGFCDVFGAKSSELIDVLRSHNIDEIVIVGLALDFCVFYSALDACRFGFKTTILLNCTKGITKEGSEKAINELKKAGVNVI